MKNFFKLLGKILLWIIVIYLLTIINYISLVSILKPKLPTLMIPAVFLSALEAFYFYYLIRKRRQRVPAADIAKENRLVGIILLICFFAIGALSSFISSLTVNQKIAIWEKAHRTLPSSYRYAVQVFNIFRIITYSIATVGLFKLLKWARIYVMILLTIVAVYSMCFASIYLWPYLPNKTTFIAIAFISNVIWLGIVIFYLTRPKVKEQFK